jgi:cytochrome P450
MTDSSQSLILHTDDFSVPPPRAPFYDERIHSWVFSYYRDVYSGLWDRALEPGGSREDITESAKTTTVLRSCTQEALSPSQIEKWRPRLEQLAQRIVSRLDHSGPLDLMKEFIRPWTLQVAFEVTHADPSQRERLCELATLISSAAADPSNPDLKVRARLADKELKQLFPDPQSPIAGPTFVALSRTLAALLSNGWLALLQHPAELACLHSHPDVAPIAVEEFLRFCAVPRTLSRIAIADTDIFGMIIPSGERVLLDVASANRDPDRFADPNRLDLSRPRGGHLTLGAGPHACVGASLIRMAMEIATRAVATVLGSTRLHGPVEWSGGSGFRWPEVFPVKLNP